MVGGFIGAPAAPAGNGPGISVGPDGHSAARIGSPALAVVEDGLDPRTSQKLSAGSTVSGGRTTGPCLDPAVHIAAS